MGNQRVIMLAVLLVVLTVTCGHRQGRGSRNRQRNKRFVNCPKRRSITNGEISQETPDGIYDNVGSVLRYTCDRFYILEGPATRRCMAGGYWEGGERRCVPITCPKMRPFDNGEVTYSQTLTKVATFATFKCDPGADLIPYTTHATCMPDRAWDRNPRCRKRCDVPNTSNGAIRYAEESLVQGTLVDGTNVTTVCDEGYEITPGQTSSVNTCTNGRLYAPICKEKSCPVPKNPPEFTSYYPSNGTVNHGARMYVQCYNRSYELVTVDKLKREKYHSCFDVHCNFGKFDELPICKERSCDPSELDDHNYMLLTDSKGRPLRAIASGDQLSATCKEGYHLQDKTADVQVKLLCDKGTLEGASPCKPTVTCPRLYGIAHGIMFQESPDGIRDDFGSVVTYTCKKFYDIEGPATRRCMANGRWEGDDPRCVPSSCPKMRPFKNGEVTYNKNPIAVATIATFKCDPGADLIPDLTHATCMPNQEWDRTPSCNRQLQINERKGDVYEIEIEEYSYWQSRYVYSYQRIDNGTVVKHNVTVRLSCTSAYELFRSGRFLAPLWYSLSTNKDGVWKPELATCKPERCDVPTTSNGRISYAEESLVQRKLLDGTNITIICDEGYEITHGQTVNTCSKGRLYVPTCTATMP